MEKHPLAGIQNERGDFREMNEAAFEEDTVKYLLSELDLQQHKFKLLGDWKLRTGQSRLTLTGFCQYFNTFPLTLVSLVTKIADSDRLHLLFKDFGQRPLLQKWKDLRAEVPRELRGRPFGVIVKWPYLPRGLLLHTYGVADRDGLRMVYRERAFELVAEPLPQAVRWLQASWSP